MAKGHRSQVKRGGNTQKGTRPNATLSHARISVQKTCLVLDTIGGKDLQTVLGIVTYSSRYVSNSTKKLPESAAADAKNNNGMDPAELYAEECCANQGPTAKGVRSKIQGYTCRTEKRTSHTIAVLDER